MKSTAKKKKKKNRREFGCEINRLTDAYFDLPELLFRLSDK